MQQHPSSELAVIDTAALPAPSERPVPYRIVEQLHQGLDGADSALRALEDDPDADRGDYEINMCSTATCAGDTLAEAFTKAAAWCKAAPTARVEAIGYRRILLPRAAEDEYADEHRLTLAFSYPEDPDGDDG